MKYTLPRNYAQAGTTVVIPDDDLNKYKREAGSMKAGINKFLFENGYITEAEYAGTKKATKAKTKREFKVDPTKSAIITYLAEAMKDYGAANVEVTNPNRLIAFTLGNSCGAATPEAYDKFEITLVKKKK